MLKFTVEKEALLGALGQANAVISRNGSIPILLNVLIEAGGDGITIRATDLDIEASYDVRAELEADGSVTVPCSVLHDIVRKMPNGVPIRIDMDAGERLRVRCGRAEFDIPTLPAEDFPMMGRSSFEVEFEMPSETFRSLFDRTRFAVANEETRYFLNGVYLHVEEGRANDDDAPRPVLRAVATDGHRLALSQTDLPEMEGRMPGVIVPRKTVLEMNKMLNSKASTVRVSVSATKIRLAMIGTSVTSKVVDGVFPPYQRIIPMANPKKLVIPGDDLGAVIDRISTISSGKGGAIKMEISEDSILFSVRTPENGLASESAGAAYSDEPMEIGFNAKYLSEIAGQIGEKNMDIHMDGSQNAILVRKDGERDSLYVLMPMRV